MAAILFRAGEELTGKGMDINYIVFVNPGTANDLHTSSLYHV